MTVKRSDLLLTTSMVPAAGCEHAKGAKDAAPNACYSKESGRADGIAPLTVRDR
jgi:hypothetical protein